MTIVIYFNIAIAVVGLVMVAFALRAMPKKRCPDPIMGDALILIAYLLMINSHYMSAQTNGSELMNGGWHIFSMAVLLNILFHIRVVSTGRHLQ